MNRFPFCHSLGDMSTYPIAESHNSKGRVESSIIDMKACVGDEDIGSIVYASDICR